MASCAFQFCSNTVKFISCLKQKYFVASISHGLISFFQTPLPHSAYFNPNGLIHPAATAAAAGPWAYHNGFTAGTQGFGGAAAAAAAGHNMIAGNPNQDGNAAAAAAALTGIFSAPTYKGGRGGGYQASPLHPF